MTTPNPTNMEETTWERDLEKIDKEYPMALDAWSVHDWKDYIRKVEREAEQRGERKGREQKYYELALQAQSIEIFMEEDAKEYGETALHGKFRAFFQKYIKPNIIDQEPPEETNGETV